MVNQGMRVAMVFFFLVISTVSPADTVSCLSLFSTNSVKAFENLDRLSMTGNKVFASQSSVGQTYARLKAFRDARVYARRKVFEKMGVDLVTDVPSLAQVREAEKSLRDISFDPSQSLSDLSPKEIEILTASLLEQLAELPIVIAPNGDVFLVDGHHDYWTLGQIANLKKISLKFTVLMDYSDSPVSLAQFKQDAIQNNWLYGDPDAIIDHPLKIKNLPDNVERSQVGLAFLLAADTFDVPFKGKNFTPFVQFRLIQLMQQEGLYDFQGTDDATIARLMKTILGTSSTVSFLFHNLQPDGSKKLYNLLLDAMMKAAWILPWISG